MHCNEVGVKTKSAAF